MEKENKYVLQYPSVMKNKKILYVHGFPFEVAVLRHFLPFKLLSVHDKLHFVAV